ncbi:unnamed protein product [Durusdinium trenchii]|uniref:Protein kinase domain-containing protein n=1 Tax=Durusdinium trenchii TaxID=1381693 RepID=A0ABP0PM26_9DINO
MTQSVQAGSYLYDLATGTPTSKTPRSSRTPKRTKSLTGAKNALMARLIGPDGNLATNALAGEEDAFRLQDLPEGRRDRKRYNCRKDPWVGEVMDLLAEEVFLRNVEQPWYLAPCMEQGSCQRVCFPAEFATRHKREKQGGHEMQGGSSNHKGNDMYEESEMNFGLPDFAQAGFSLDNTDELGWPDMNVPNKLGLVQAIHRKTSIERLCLIKPKHELPPKSGPKEVRSLVRQLQKCDHANVLYLHEALEDQSHLYFMYEQYSCVTLQSVLDTQWTQEDIVQIARECAAAMAFAASMNLLHLSWTLSHVLIPATRRKHPMLCKVFGLGLMGVVINDTSSSDHLCWAPECIERFHHVGPNGFLQKVEQSMKPMCDSWSLGTIVYSLVCRRPPAVTEAQAQSKKWSFTLAIDDAAHLGTAAECARQGITFRRLVLETTGAWEAEAASLLRRISGAVALRTGFHGQPKVVKHVEAAELGLEDEDEDDVGTKDHAIDYNEFMQLFPVRVQRIRELKDRLQGYDDMAKELCKLLEDGTPGVERWLRSMETATLTIQDLASKVVDPRHVETLTEAAKALRKQFGKLDEGLKAPPGPSEPQELALKLRSGKAAKSQKAQCPASEASKLAALMSLELNDWEDNSQLALIRTVLRIFEVCCAQKRRKEMHCVEKYSCLG